MYHFYLQTTRIISISSYYSLAKIKWCVGKLGRLFKRGMMFTSIPPRRRKFRFELKYEFNSITESAFTLLLFC